MLKVDITIPLFYNDKEHIEVSKLNKVKNELLRFSSGLSINHDSIGYWLNNGCMYDDINRIYTIIIENTKDNIIKLKEIKSWLAWYLRQKEIFIVTYEVNIL